MTPPGKSAALRIPPREDTTDTGAAGFEAAIRNAAAARMRPRPADVSREKLLSFPGSEATRAPAQPVERASEAATDLGPELEAALMSDLQTMVASFDEVARAPTQPELAPPPAVSPPQAAAEALQAAEPDQEALDRLLASIRLSDRAPRRQAPAVLKPGLDDAALMRGRDTDGGLAGMDPVGDLATPADIVSTPSESGTAALAKRNPNSPRPNGRDDRLASPLPRARKPAAGLAASATAPHRIASKAEPVPALRLAIPGARRAYVKPAIAVSLLILLATVGAGMTIRALTARNDTTPSTAGDAPAAATAKVEAETGPTVAATPPTTIAKAETQPMAATPATEAPARVAVDNSVLPAIPAEMTQPTVMLAAPIPAPTVPLQPAAAQSQAPAANVAVAEPAPSAPEPSDIAAAAPKASASVESTTGMLKPGPGRIASGVKLRTNPDNGAPVIAVLGQGAGVEIVSCKGWCEIVAGDKRGFVYQKFLSTAGG